jgi:poly(A) polymerase
VESKIRYLTTNLERIPHINLAHVNPKCYDQSPPVVATIISSSQEAVQPPQSPTSNSENGVVTKEPAAVVASVTLVDGKAPYCSMWFIGLEFERSENLNVDLTESIPSFADSVHKHAVRCKPLCG